MVKIRVPLKIPNMDETYKIWMKAHLFIGKCVNSGHCKKGSPKNVAFSIVLK